MNIKRFSAIALAALLAAAPAGGNDGGDGGGGHDNQRKEQPKQAAPTPPTEPTPPPESVLESIDDGWTCPAPKGQGSATTAEAPASLQNFYKDTIGFFDENIEKYEQLLNEKTTEIEGLDHKLAVDFTAAHAGDKSHDDTIKSAGAVLATVPSPNINTPFGAGPLGATPLADPELLRAVNAIRQVRDAAKMLKLLKEARAIVAGEARGCGVVID